MCKGPCRPGGSALRARWLWLVEWVALTDLEIRRCGAPIFLFGMNCRRVPPAAEEGKLLPNALFNDSLSFLLLWPLSIVCFVAALIALFYTDPELSDGIYTVGGRNMITAKIYLILCCGTVWIETIVGYRSQAIPGAASFPFWRSHFTLFIFLFFLVDILAAFSVRFSWRASGTGRRLLMISTACLLGISLLCSFLSLTAI